jgi:hypothetical protein
MKAGHELRSAVINCCLEKNETYRFRSDIWRRVPDSGLETSGTDYPLTQRHTSEERNRQLDRC